MILLLKAPQLDTSELAILGIHYIIAYFARTRSSQLIIFTQSPITWRSTLSPANSLNISIVQDTGYTPLSLSRHSYVSHSKTFEHYLS